MPDRVPQTAFMPTTLRLQSGGSVHPPPDVGRVECVTGPPDWGFGSASSRDLPVYRGKQLVSCGRMKSHGGGEQTDSSTLMYGANMKFI